MGRGLGPQDGQDAEMGGFELRESFDDEDSLVDGRAVRAPVTNALASSWSLISLMVSAAASTQVFSPTFS
jgi:hypothetical protein